jgi:hypothetical protein
MSTIDSKYFTATVTSSNPQIATVSGQYDLTTEESMVLTLPVNYVGKYYITYYQTTDSGLIIDTVGSNMISITRVKAIEETVHFTITGIITADTIPSTTLLKYSSIPTTGNPITLDIGGILSVGEPTPRDQITYEWLIDDVSISKTTGDIGLTFNIPASTDNKLLKTIVTYGSNIVSTSSTITTAAIPGIEGELQIDNLPYRGNTITVDKTSIIDADGIPDSKQIKYSWTFDNKVTTGTSFTIPDTIDGTNFQQYKLSVSIEYTNLKGTTRTISKVIPLVRKPDMLPTGNMLVAGKFSAGEKITVDISNIMDGNGFADPKNINISMYKRLPDKEIISGAKHSIIISPELVVSSKTITPEYNVSVVTLTIPPSATLGSPYTIALNYIDKDGYPQYTELATNNVLHHYQQDFIIV